MNELFYPIVIPVIFGFVILVLPGASRMIRGVIALIGAVAAAWYAGIVTFGAGPVESSWVWFTLEGFRFAADLRLDSLSRLMLFPVTGFTVLIILYSLGARHDAVRPREYYTYLLWTAGMSAATLLADNLLLLLVGWEAVSVLLFLLVTLGDQSDREAAGKTFVITGFSDCALLAGVLMLWVLTGTARVSEIQSVSTANTLGGVIFLLFFAAALVKSGAMPGHTWIPAAAEHAPVSVMAFLPASLDKLLGIYLLARISLDMFALTGTLAMLLLVIGALTIILAVMMALIQHDLKKLLAFHAVSQVGYMLLGIGSGVAVGIVGGLFHMLNNAIYKSCLFLGAGAVEEQAGTTDLEKLGGMKKTLPLTFVCMVVAALAISGVPPFNGFASKWLIYQGMVEISSPLFLIAAMFGSALTLASFIKVIYSVYLGKRPPSIKPSGKENLFMVLPMAVLALLCVLFGVFAQIPLRYFIGPAAGLGVQDAPGIIALARAMWSPTFTTLLILIALLFGWGIYLLGTVGKQRATTPFVGGEIFDTETIRFPGTGFYETIRILEPLKTLYRDAESGVYDLYVLGGAYGRKLVDVLRATHNGVISTYVSFALIGLLGILFFLMW